MKLKTPFESGKPKRASAPLQARAPSARLYLQALEPRVLLDAAAAKTVQEAAPAPAPEPVETAPDQHAALVEALAAVQQQEQAAPQASAEPARTEVYFIDRQVADADRLAQGLPAGAEVHFIESNVDGVQFIAQTLQGRTDIDAVHILSHGVEGQLRLGTAFLDVQHMQSDYRAVLAAIGQSMAADGDILIYGCDFAAGSDGQQAVQMLAELNSARSLGGTRELTATSGVVLQAVRDVDSLDGTALLGENGVVLQAVNSLGPLQGSASYDRLDTSMERQLLSMDAMGPRAEVVSSLRLGDGLSLEFTAGRQQVSVELTSGEPVREVRATLADGRSLPPWMHMDSRGYLLIDRPAGVEQVRLRLTVVKQNGASVTHTIEVDFNSGELKQIPARGAGTRVGMDDAARSHAPALASAPGMDFVAQLERAAQRTSEADAQLLQALEAAG